MSDKESLLSEMMRMIPGYGAYRDQESRREDDRLTREFVARRLQDCKRALDKLGARAVSVGNLDTPAKMEKFRSSIDLAQTRLTAAVEGYSSWFSARQVDAALLAKIGELDANLVSIVDQMDASLTAAATGEATVNESELTANLELLHKRIDRRSEWLRDGQ